MDQRKAIDRNFLRSLTSLGIAILLGGIFSGDRVDAEVPPSSTSKRMMLFLGRDAVVKESEETQILLGANQSLSIDRGTIPTAVRSANENQYVATAAQTLTTYLEKVTGQRVVDQGVQHIQLHAGGIPTETFPELSNADAHGFVIATRTDGLHIAGASGIGTLFGVWFFLQNYADVRILMQGDLGEYVRKQENLTIPKELYIFNPGPDFHLRIHSGLQNLNPNAWLQDQGNHPGVEEPLRSQLKEWDTQRFFYHHNAFEIYDPKEFGNSHPEYYPTIGGKRFIPSPNIKSGWQPVFSEPAVVQRAIDYADQQFGANPFLRSISLTPNDGGHWAEQDELKAKERGIPTREIFYEYVNQVARGIRHRWPDRFVSTLCYNEWQEPPSFSLEENCMVFVWTKDGNAQSFFEKWKGKAKHFGSYQWIYGMMYPFPNQWPHAMQDFLKLVRSYGAHAFKSEFYDVHGHGCVRLWVLSNLLWNADADVDGLLEDYYRHAYGIEAAPAMERYFAQWEKIYERRRMGNDFNLVDRKGAEKNFEKITDEDIEECHQALAKAMAVVRGDENRRRIDIVTRLFERARLYYRFCQSLKRMDTLSKQSSAEENGLPFLKAASDLLVTEQQIYAWNHSKIEPEATYCGSPPNGRGEKNKPWPINFLAMDPRIIHVTADSKWVKIDHQINQAIQAVSRKSLKSSSLTEVLQFWREFAKQYPILEPYSESEQLRLSEIPRGLRNLIANPSFEKPAAPESSEAKQLLEEMRTFKIGWMDADNCQVPYVAADHWNAFENRSPERVVVQLDPAEYREGKRSLRVSATGQVGGVLTNVVLPDSHSRYRLTFWYKSPEGAKIVYGFMYHQIRHTPYFQKIEVGAKEWTQVELEFPMIHELGPSETPALSLWLGVANSEKVSTVWFDDLRLEQLSERGALPVATPSPRIGNRHQLFLDDDQIEFQENLKRRVQPVKKSNLNPLIRRSYDWEPQGYVLPAVLYDEQEKIYKAWIDGYGVGVFYFTSQDGLHWQRSLEHRFPEFDDQPTHRVILSGHEIDIKQAPMDKRESLRALRPGWRYFGHLSTVIKDVRDPDPLRRYKMSYLWIDRAYRRPGAEKVGKRTALGVAFSPDGIHWTPLDAPVSDATTDVPCNVIFNSANQRWALFGRAFGVIPEAKKEKYKLDPLFSFNGGRAVVRAESDDFVHWTPSQGELVMASDEIDGPLDEIYGLRPFYYEGIYLGIVHMFYNYPQNIKLDMQLAMSRDGKNFRRLSDRSPILPVGELGAWDRSVLSPQASDPVEVGDEIRFYYTGRNQLHSSRFKPEDHPDLDPTSNLHRGALGVGSVLKDRFVAMEASFRPGILRTKPFVCEGTRIHLNASVPFGSVQVQIIKDGKRFGRSMTIQGEDAIDLRLPQLDPKIVTAKESIQIEFTLQNGKLFSFWID